jgi:glutamine amidotransferase
MCELMGLAFARPISADFSIREFALRGEENADGWGLAWYPDRSVAVVKEPLQWKASKYTGFLEKYDRLSSPLYIAHVRHGTTGGAPTRADTHPFARELGGRDICFAHNGTLVGMAGEYPLGRFRPVGATDSEYAFCHLLDQLADQPNALRDEAGWRWLHEKLASLNRLGKLNCLMSDGERLFCYHDAARYKGLNLRRVVVRGKELRRFEDSTVTIDLERDDTVRDFNRGYVVATCALSAAGWSAFEGGELVVLERGEIRYSSYEGRVAKAKR